MMWTRKECKAQAKEALQRNYWRIVLVSFLILLFCCGFPGGGGSSGTRSSGSETTAQNIAASDAGQQEKTIIVPEKARMVGIVIFVLIAILIILFIYTLEVLLAFPFRVGACRFMIKSIDDRAKVKEVTYAFDHSYKNVVKAMFHYDIRVFLWYLLFIIPGFYKQYQYYMVPYILAEHPDMDYREVLKRSAAMMDGHKWKAFVLDLSFIPWHILGIITCGIVELFYVAPYYYLAIAALYRRLSSPEASSQEPSGKPLSLPPSDDSPTDAASPYTGPYPEPYNEAYFEK